MPERGGARRPADSQYHAPVAMIDDITSRARAAIARGDLLAAYDLVRSDAVQGSTEHAFLAALALARMDAAEEASRLYQNAGLGDVDDVDSRALGARLLKDRALADLEHPALLGEAASAYARIFELTADPFPAINAATLSLLSGDQKAAIRFATAALAAPTVDDPSDYYGAATKAEALAILGRFPDAERALQAALGLPGADFGARSTTLRQFQHLASKLGGEQIATLIDLLRPPVVAVYTGHIFRADATREAVLAAQIDALIAQQQIGFGYGALAAGGDILIAERLLAKGAEVHLVLPFAEQDFIAQSVAPAGTQWLERYTAVREKVISVSFATIAASVHDPAQFGYGANVAMGLARLRARHLATDVTQLALWDRRLGKVAGTGHDVASWQASGGATNIVEAGELDRSFDRMTEMAPAAQRSLKALLFADFPGFTRIPETKLPIFWDLVMSAAGRLLARYSADVEFANSWGDALFVVVDSVEAAANIALDFQDMLAEVDATKFGLSTSAQMRVSVHYGPVYSGTDVIANRKNFYGLEVSRAARVEPMTPPGSVYVSEPFAAILANTAPDRFATTYVGKLELPKNFGQYPLFALRRT